MSTAIELTSDERRALGAIEMRGTNGLNGKELQAATGLERKVALAAINKFQARGLVEKNMWNRSVITEAGSAALYGRHHDEMRDAAAESYQM